MEGEATSDNRCPTIGTTSDRRHDELPNVAEDVGWRQSIVKKLTAAAQAILDSRAAHPNATLADLYDPLTMPPDLVKAHAHLDALVDKAYGFSRDGERPSLPTDADRVALLFKLYADKTQR